MNNNKLYFISKNLFSEEESDYFWKNFEIFTDLKDALDKLNKLYKNTSDFKSHGFCVKTLIKQDNKYIRSHQTYYHQKGYS